MSQDDAFVWGDPDVAGSRLDPQTAEFARRAAELWTQVVGLREVCAKSGGEQVQDAAAAAAATSAAGRNDAGTFARAVEQVIRRELPYVAPPSAFIVLEKSRLERQSDSPPKPNILQLSGPETNIPL